MVVAPPTEGAPGPYGGAVSKWQIALLVLLAESVAVVVGTAVVGWPVLLVSVPIVLTTAVITLVLALFDVAERRTHRLLQDALPARLDVAGPRRGTAAPGYVDDHGTWTDTTWTGGHHGTHPGVHHSGDVGTDCSWSDSGWSSSGSSSSSDSSSGSGSSSDSGSSSTSSSSSSDSSC